VEDYNHIAIFRRRNGIQPMCTINGRKYELRTLVPTTPCRFNLNKSSAEDLDNILAAFDSPRERMKVIMHAAMTTDYKAFRNTAGLQMSSLTLGSLVGRELPHGDAQQNSSAYHP
jgi:hypothetical protein